MSQLKRLFCLIFVAATLPFAAADAQAQVPDALAPWQDWVLHGEEFRRCPVMNGSAVGQRQSHVCAWPGELTLAAGPTGATFSQTWTLYAPDWVPLPGDGDRWPHTLVVDGDAEPAVMRDGRPALRLAPGTHRIAGEISWATRPASLQIPVEVGLVALRVDDRPVANPEIERGTLWLGLRPDGDIEEDRLDVVVYRHLHDALPQRLTTIVRLDVAGQSREVTLTGAALAGFVGEALDSELPVQLAPDGQLRVQLRPGRWEVELTARAPALVAALTVGAAAEPWPAEEIWSFATEPRLRVAALEGAEAVDTERAGVPDQWRDLPSYRVTAGQSVDVVERSRNDAAEANRLSLRRDLWLDFDGGDFTARDVVTGQMRSRWRLDMAAPYTMTMAAIDDENLLITAGPESGLQGVELRAAELALTGTARVDRAGRLPVSGYRQRFDDVTTTLHVPPAYRVIAVPGADFAGGVWLENWRLLDVFLLLIITAAVWRLFGAVPGLVALAALVLMYHEPGAPRWAWLNLLAAIALLRVAPEGRLRTFCRRYQLVSMAALAVLLIPFTVGQLRTAIFPQLERPQLERGVAATPTSLNELLSLVRRGQSVDSIESRARLAEAPQPLVLEEAVVAAARRIGSDVPRYLPGALVQTGPGLPDWIWTRHSLRFSGPVEADDSFRLVMLGPVSVALWRVASVALALALLFVLVGRSFQWPALRNRGAHSALAVLVLVGGLAGLVLPDVGNAQDVNEFPSPALLEELKSRLTEPAPCHPACAELTQATVTLTATELRIDLELATQDAVAVPVPGVPRGWQPQQIMLDGAATGFLYRDRAERSWLSIGAGVHRVRLSGAPPADSFVLPFPLPPRRIAVDAPGWDVAGVTEGRLRSGALELIRQRAADDADDEIAATVFAPYVRVVRRIEFAIDWTVTTTVERVAPADGAFTLRIGLLANEAVITPGIDVAGGLAAVAFAPGEDVVVWRSRLPTAATLNLAAPVEAAWSESWQFVVGQIWHADYAGMPSTAPLGLDPAFYVPEYFPRPGETLTVNLRRPDPAGGDTIAIDTVDYTRNVGARASESTLALSYRSTRGTEHVLTLPADSELQSVTIDGDAVPLRLDGSRLSIPVTPGEHDAEITWRNAIGVGVRTVVAPVDLGGGASNVHMTLNLPEDRWTLMTFGPRLGPAVLYWPELLAFALGAMILGRMALSPLRTHEWLLLGFGLSTFAWPVLLLFAVWAFALSWRGQSRLVLRDRWFNLLQVGLGALTIFALAALIAVIPVGLLGRPDMQIASPVGYSELGWFVDRTSGATPTVGAVSASLWFYKAAMLAWALWLSFALLRWLRGAWRAFSHEGLWRRQAPA